MRQIPRIKGGSQKERNFPLLKNYSVDIYEGTYDKDTYHLRC